MEINITINERITDLRTMSGLSQKELCKKIGLETMEDLLLFKTKIQQKGETVLEALQRYADELGEDFRLMEVQNEIY